MPIRHLYVHVPFCPTICPFCSFHVLERRGDAVAQYLVRLDDELARIADTWPMELDTVYVGGGTPSHLRLHEMEQLCAIVEQRVGWAEVEATLEVHPSTATATKAQQWADLGFDRLSVGAQSFDDDVLRRLGRPNDAVRSRAAVEWCAATGATTGVDVIVAVEGQDAATDLSTAAALGADHISAYTLTIEPGTPFERDGVVVPDERAAAALVTASEVLGAAGFERYEVSNYARGGARCAHNVAYWTGAWFVGVGPSASSFLPAASGLPGSKGACRTRNADFGAWLDGAEPDVAPVEPGDLLGDALLCGLRMLDGIDLDEVARRVGMDARVERGDTIDRLVADGLLARAGTRLWATDAGLMVLDRIAAELL